MALIDERKRIKKYDKERLKEVSKKKNASRDTKRSRRQEKIQRILENFKGIRSISSVESEKEKDTYPHQKMTKGEVITSRKRNCHCLRGILKQTVC